MTTVTVLRSGGRDDRGNPRPELEHEIKGCIVAPRTSTEDADREDTVASGAEIYVRGVAAVDLVSTDRVRIPPGAPMSGLWRVVGEVEQWNFGGLRGVKVSLARGA